MYLHIFIFFLFPKDCCFLGCALSECGSPCHYLLCFWDNENWKCVLLSTYTDCHTMCWLCENADTGAVGEMVRFVYIYRLCVPWSYASPRVKPSLKSISPYWLLLHTVYVLQYITHLYKYTALW